MYYTVEIPHQFPATIHEWASEDEAFDHYGDAAGLSSQYAQWCEDNGMNEDSAESYWEWASHDLHESTPRYPRHLRRWLYRFDTLEELIEWAGGNHQSARILAQAEAFLQEA